MRRNAKDRLASFKAIHYDVPREFIQEGLKSERNLKSYRIVEKEIEKLTGSNGVFNRANHLLKVYERIKMRVGP